MQTPAWMIGVTQPLANGDYTVNWTTIVENNPSEYSGEVRFSVQVEQQ